MSDLPLRKRFFINGEPAPALELHTPYLKPAYKLLDQARAQMGDALQQHSRRVTLEDGARLEAHMRHGQAEIWIDVPRSGGVPVPPPEPDEPLPYLWVGARVAWERMPQFADYNAFVSALGGNLRDVCQLHVWEPGENGIIGTAPLLPIEFLRPGDTLEATQSREAMQGVVPEHAQVAAERGFVTIIPPPFAGDPFDVDFYKFIYTRHMMYMTAWGFSPLTILDSASSTLPTYDPRYIYDPLEGDDQWTKRQINIELDTEGDETGSTSAFPTTWPLWDSVVVLDPYFGNIEPTDRRGFLPIEEVATREALPFGAAQVIPGNYVIKVGAKGFTCPAQNIEIDLEVRLTKAPHTTRQRYQITVPNAGYAARLATPYGWRWPADGAWPCPEYTGTNPHSHNWWQGAVLANVHAGTQRRVELLVPSHGFDPAFFKFGCPPHSGGEVPGDELYVGWGATSVSAGWRPYAAEVTARIILQGQWGFIDEYPLDEYRASQGLPPILADGYGAELKAAAQRDIADDPLMGGFYWFDRQNMRFIEVPVSSGNLLDDPDGWAEPYYTAANAAGNNMIYYIVGWANGYYLANGSTTCLAA